MQTNDPSEKYTTFYDRLSLVKRIKFDGRHEQVGGNEGGIKLRIKNHNTPILTLHLASTLFASATIRTFDITHISADGYCIHLYLNEYGIHKVRRGFAFHFSNDEIAAKKFFDTYVSMLPPDISKECPTYFDLIDDGLKVESVEVKNKYKKKLTVDEHSGYDDSDGDGDTDGDNEDDKDDWCDDDDNDNKDDGADTNADTNNEPFGLNLDDGFEESQDVYADNCLISLGKKW